MVSSRFEIKLSSGETRCRHGNTGLEEKRKKKVCHLAASSCRLGTSGLPTEAINTLELTCKSAETGTSDAFKGRLGVQ